jgi:hypothetical protein
MGARLARPYRAPATTVLLGCVLDLQLEHDGHRITVTGWEGWAMLTDADAMERAPGRARLYLAPWTPERGRGRGARSHNAEDTYRDWHQRDPLKRVVLDVPDSFGVCQGRVCRIGYRSDKWGRRGKTHDYDHDFRQGGHAAPLLYTDARTLDGARGAVICGGDMRVTERGID